MKKLLFISVSSLSLFVLHTSFANVANVIPYGNGTWAYDSVYGAKKTTNKKLTEINPGLFADNIEKYNEKADPKHQMNEIFSYGGDLEMYCLGAGGSLPITPCFPENLFLFAYYNPGNKSTQAYANKIKNAKMVPIVDGRFDNTGADDLLSPMNKNTEMAKEIAEYFADQVAKKYCADDLVAGVQFDLEPFDYSILGQKSFYDEIAYDFAGKNFGDKKKDQFGCVDDLHPNGRFFSIFTFSDKVNADVAAMLNRYNNGYIIDSLYDLGPKQGGELNTPDEFRLYATQEVANMRAISASYNVKYQFAIPAAASAHEFESKAGVPTNYKQLQYVKNAIDVIDTSGARSDSNFIGIDIWSWNQKMFWHGNQYTPESPPADVLDYLKDHL